MPLSQIDTSVLVPAVISLVIMALAWWNIHHVRYNSPQLWGGALAFALAFAAGYYFTFGWPDFPPQEAGKWLGLFALGAGIIGFLFAREYLPVWLAWLVRFGAAVYIPYILLTSYRLNVWEEQQAIIWIVCLALAIALFWGFVDNIAWWLHGPATPLALCIATAGLGYVMLLGKSAFLAQLGGILAVALGAAAIIGFWRPAMSVSIGGTAVFVVLYASLLLAGYFYAEVPASSAVWLAIAPLAAVLGLNDAARKKYWLQLVYAVVAVLIPVCLAIWLASGSSEGNGWETYM